MFERRAWNRGGPCKRRRGSWQSGKGRRIGEPATRRRGIVGLFATQWDRWVGMSTRQVTDDAYVRGDITPLSAKVEGYVHRVAVDDFDRVKAGDPLVEIDDSDYQARVAQAEADLLGAEGGLENLKSRNALHHS